MDRAHNLRSWLYRIHPSTFHGAYTPFKQNHWQSLVKDPSQTSPAPMRWQPFAEPTQEQDFVDGVTSQAGTYGPAGVAIHQYQFNKKMGNRFFQNADGELIIVPQRGSIQVNTEMGILNVEPQEVVVIPRGIKFQINPQSSGWCRGYMAENMGHPFVLPNLGPLGANGLANPRDFFFPRASFEQDKGSCQVISKFSHNFWSYEQKHSPFDVVAWHGNYAPYKYDLRKFNTMGSVSYDHPDPSIYTVLTSPSTTPGVANLDFVIFPPRWLVAENTFRPPYYHRNIMSEYMGLIHGAYDAKQGGFVPGGSSLHNCMSAHGPDTETLNNAMAGSESPQKVTDTMAFMFESCQILHPTEEALNSPQRDLNYTNCWQGFEKMYGEK